MKTKRIKVIFDTNVWISFLIGKRLSMIEKYISNSQITIIVTDQLLTEIREVTGREKLKIYFPEKSVEELLGLLKMIAQKIDIQPTHFVSQDPKDNFLLDLIDYSKADYLVTGDKELFKHNPFKTAIILTPTNFEKIINGF